MCFLFSIPSTFPTFFYSNPPFISFSKLFYPPRSFPPPPRLFGTLEEVCFECPLLEFDNFVSNLKITEAQSKRLESSENCSRKVINGDAHIIKIQDCKIWHTCKFVRKCLDGTSCENFHDYFTKIEHTQNTRSNKYLLRIPKLRTQFKKKPAQLIAAKMYTGLPLETRKEPSFSLFADKPTHFFKHEKIFPMIFIKNFILFYTASLIMSILIF